MDLTPTIPLGNNEGNSNNGWGDAVGAFAGALFGSWFGNGWGGGNWGGNNGGGGSSSTPAVVITGNGCGSTAELDALSNISTTLGSLGLQTLQGQNSANMAMCQGFSGVVAADNANTAALTNAVTQGFAGLNTAVLTGDQSIQNSMCQGFNGLQQSVLISGKDNALLNCQSTNAITTAISNCCCETQKTIMSEGQATRDLISKYAYEDLQTKLCDSKAENAALKSQIFMANSQAAQTAQIQQALNNQNNQWGTVLSAFRAGQQAA